MGSLRGKTTNLSELSGLLRDTHDGGVGVVELSKMIGFFRGRLFEMCVEFEPEAIVDVTT
jgi:hypothetical protein